MKHSCLSLTYTKSAAHLMVITWRSGKLYRHSTLCCEVCGFCLFKPSGHYMYRTVVTICTVRLTFTNPIIYRHRVFMCFVWIWEPTAFNSLYSITWTVFITDGVFTTRYVLHSTFYLHIVLVFCVDLRTNSDYFTVQHWLVGFEYWDGVCLLSVTSGIFICCTVNFNIQAIRRVWYVCSWNTFLKSNFSWFPLKLQYLEFELRNWLLIFVVLRLVRSRMSWLTLWELTTCPYRTLLCWL